MEEIKKQAANGGFSGDSFTAEQLEKLKNLEKAELELEKTRQDLSKRI